MGLVDPGYAKLLEFYFLSEMQCKIMKGIWRVAMTKMFLVGPRHFNYTTGLGMALERIGLDVAVEEYEGYFTFCPKWKKYLTKMGYPAFEKKFRDDWNNHILKRWDEVRPDVCLVLNGYLFYPETIKKMRDSGTTMILWLLDSIRRNDTVPELIGNYDTIYSFDHQDCDYVEREFNKKCEYQNYGFDPEVYSPASQMEKDIDIYFVGAKSSYRLPILQQIARYAEKEGKSFVIHGRFWDTRRPWKRWDFSNRFHPLEKYSTNTIIPSKNVAEYYNRSKVCLNIHIDPDHGVNTRTFEIMATGSFQIVDKHLGLTSLVEAGKHLVCASETEWIEKIDYYLNHPQEREQIAHAGMQKAYQDFTLDAVVHKMFSRFV